MNPVQQNAWTILVADDHDIVRFGTPQLIQTHFSGAKILTASHFDQVLATVGKEPVDLVILDINIPGGDNLSMIERIQKRRPDIKILLFSSYSEQMYALPFMRAGADGYVGKNASQQMLVEAILNVLNGKKHLSPEMQQASIDVLLNARGAATGFDHLTPREVEVAQLLSKGMNTAQVGEKLALSNSAVAMYRQKLFQKLGVTNVIELVDLMRLFRTNMAT